MSISYLRGIPKTCGLFDTGITDVNQIDATSVKDADLTTIDASDILTNLSKDDSFSIGNIVSNIVDNPGIEDDFAEQFLDLSEFLFKLPAFQAGNLFESVRDRTMDLDDTPVFSLDIGDEGATQAVKRKSSEMINSSKMTPIPNPDHNDYISKRPRLASYAESDVSDGGPRSRLTSAADSDVSDYTSGSFVSGRGQKYVERRRKNNIASKRSRETRKQKYSIKEVTADKLEAENEDLRHRIVEMEKLTKEMKATLVQRLAHGK